MKLDHSSRIRRDRMRRLKNACALLAAFASWPVAAALADLSSVPLGTLSPDPPRVNLMFILDDSGSMDRDYIPETSSGAQVYTGLCHAHYALNKLAFNPNTDYEVPPLADVAAGTYAVPTIGSVPVNGFNPGGDRVNLSTGPLTSGKTKYYYAKYPASGPTTNCSSLVAVTSLATEREKKNYAIWYAFYRTRMLMMKSSSGRALASIDASKYRVGFTTISSTASTNGTKFHGVGAFDEPISATDKRLHRTAVLTKLYDTAPSGYTPLRSALVKAGRYYANKLQGQVDPIQYTCQRNFALLTTDGYWNTRGEPYANYVPLKPDGSAFSPSDGDAGKPAPYGDAYPYSLADIAHYYYETDLRPELANVTKVTSYKPLVEEVVPQRMNTITLGLGVNGTLAYRADYDDAYLKTLTWPNPGTLPSLDTGDSVIPRIDDLWHAAVNGRGRYYSASEPGPLVQSLKAALDAANNDTGAAAAASVSSLTPTATDNQVFVPSFDYLVDADQTVKTPWQGDLRAFRLVVKEGVIKLPDLSGKEDWSAQAKLDARTSARRILFNKGGSFAEFRYNEFDAATKLHFDARCADSTPLNQQLTQCVSLNATAKAKVTGENLVNYLRGEEKTLYLGTGTNADNQVFRRRTSIMGDIINSSPVFVGRPPFRYADAEYAAFIADKRERKQLVYVGANDGMLHAFNASSGVEEWAYVPTAVIPELWRLADSKYDANHRAFVDATPTLADVFVGGKWHTILVGGLGGGGRQFYALDVTEPDSPKLLWEYSATDDPNLGLTYGNPIVTKLMDGQWVAIFTSGYNNVSPGDGRGYLYVLDAYTGKPMPFSPIAAGSPAGSDDQQFGSPATPSNLGKINAWIDSDSDNSALRIYGGDMLGNLWRFDINDLLGDKGHEGVRLGVARDSKGKLQPITTRPLMTRGGAGTLVSFGTGKYLHGKDLEVQADSSIYGNQQSIYVYEDDLSIQASTNASLRSNLTARNSATDAKVNFVTSNGFYTDLAEARERVHLDGLQFNGLISFASSVPDSNDPCQSGGHSNLYYFTNEGTFEGKFRLNDLIVGGTRVFNPTPGGGQGDGSDGGKLIWTDSTGKLHEKEAQGPGVTPAGTKMRRASWRELID